MWIAVLCFSVFVIGVCHLCPLAVSAAMWASGAIRKGFLCFQARGLKRQLKLALVFFPLHYTGVHGEWLVFSLLSKGFAGNCVSELTVVY